MNIPRQLGATAPNLKAQLIVLLLITAAFDSSLSAQATSSDAGGESVLAADATPETVMFSFSGVSWREVIEWIAEEADLALHVDGVPAGSFTYSDPDSFTHQEAIDRINLFLLPQGYSLVRRGNLLSVINLSDPRSLEQLDALAPLVSVDQLIDRPKHDVVKCLFPLGALDAEDAVEELSAIKLMTKPSVFSKTNQLMITDTVSKLTNVKAILDSFEPSKLDNGTVVKSFPLKHVDAEDVLTVARPHLGLATGEMIGIDVSLSADPKGKFLYATGIEDKIKLIERLVESVDVPTKSITDESADARLQSHQVAGGNVDLAYDVLQTLLVGRDVRISKDENAGTIVALAPQAIQDEIALAVAKLAAEEPAFEVIELDNVDPFVAIALIEQMLDLPGEFDFDEDERDDDDSLPKLDADLDNGRLFVRAKPAQVKEIKEIVAGLSEQSTSERATTGSGIQWIPITGAQAVRSLQIAARFWRMPNPIIVFESDSIPQQTRERIAYGDATLHSPPSLPELPTEFVSISSRGRLLDSPATNAEATPIECQMTSRGILVQCEDADVLESFQEHVEAIVGVGVSITAEPIVYYLKYTRGADAIKMLAELIDGGVAATPTSQDALVNASISSPTSSLLGSLVMNRDGTLTLISGTATVVADPRLNRLIVQGSPDEIAQIEQYLRIIEKDSSITSIETYGRSHVIELVNTRATDVEVALRQAFAGRVMAAAGAPQQGGQQQGQPNDPRAAARNGSEQENRKSDNEKKKPNPKASSSQQIASEPKMTLAVHEPSNSLIVTAPDALYQEVKALAEVLDGRAEQTIEVITPANSEALEAVLQEIILGQSGSSSTPNRRPTKPRER
ncbi:MAG: secretin N-terminal domain-containing protein [Planctomycetota bacterium]